jgi:hypothetical protein
VSTPTIEILTRPLWGGCQELKRRLTDAGVPFVECDVATSDGLAAWAWYDAPPLLPCVAVDGRLLDGSGDPDGLFEAITKGKPR